MEKGIIKDIHINTNNTDNERKLRERERERERERIKRKDTELKEDRKESRKSPLNSYKK